ncbi:glycosyltransferase family 32 protein [Luteolibacter marinus]|uniref:glycosyltransferase family 32 protein n=1 Tax=Luteolibacter marinus TaxID=2776705 RepID=UPI0018675FD5|nr:hypothetical protein [Luteolibacter marinus]
MLEIPKTIHQIWLGDNPFPEAGEAWTGTYREYMPDWEVKRWGDADLEELAGKLICPHLVLDESVGMGIRCDVLRYEIVRLFGGLYLDHDMEIFRPLDEIMIEGCLHFALSFNALDDVSTAMFASPPGHPFWDLLLEDLGSSVPSRRPEDPWEVLDLTGFRAVRKNLRTLLGGTNGSRALKAEDGWVAGWLFDEADLVTWSREAVHPYHVEEMRYDAFRKEDYPRAFAAHHWQGEWVSRQ